ncbi:cysteine--tRNA ligase [Peredibacter starrii]|uniref:Cysteine--tRNA ligase n=1 Tax=Peredibacter starrii TaxID=28202 RepID=A0AAX4HSJ4_9BACT|nr:cysteine--tRNA ligase [Peredibacter starrii]WPU66269.1 cysteine--tRNA ligase [Peredibacter starrii]
MARELKVHNNLTRKKEVFQTIEPGKVKFYSCGPTTYDFLHIGNARALVVGDLFNRVLKAFGYDVTFVRNYTDVDDKIIDRAKELKRDPIEHAALFVKECETDMNSLGMMPATHTPKVTETMPEIIKMIEDIIKNGSGYVVEGGEVLFNVPSFAEYGKLSKKDLESLQHGIRVDVDSRKKNPSDFVLWKPAKAGEPAWDSPWGKGRPGWHIECSAMAKKFLGPTLDLHHGGVDLMFPHHENEIAQSEAANKCPFCNNWAHNEFLNFGTEKMSKSLGNVIKIRDFVEKYGGQVLRHILLSVHYRARLEWSDEVLQRALDEVKRIHEFALEAKTYTSAANPSADGTISETIEKMMEELSNDFNSAGALGHFFSFIRYVKANKDKLSAENIVQVNNTIKFVEEALGLINKDPQAVIDALHKHDQDTSSTGVDAAWIEGLIEERKAAKAAKNWARADEIRKELTQKSIELKDNPDGSTSWKVQS